MSDKNAAAPASLADRLARVDDTYTETYTVDGWQLTFLLRSPTVRTRFAFQAWRDEVKDDPAQLEERTWLGAIIACACDPETGDRAFTWADVDLLASKNPNVLVPFGVECLKVMGMTNGVSEDLKGSTSPTEGPNGSTRSG